MVYLNKSALRGIEQAIASAGIAASIAFSTLPVCILEDSSEKSDQMHHNQFLSLRTKVNLHGFGASLNRIDL